MKSRSRWAVAREPMVLLAALSIVLGIWAFALVTEDVIDGDTQRFDRAIMTALRQTGNPAKLVGPAWMETVVRDLTALGGVAVLVLLVAAVAGILLLVRRTGMLWLVLAATLGATLLNTGIKWIVARPRPQFVPKLTDVSSASFPSGHSAMSAAVYLTLAALLAQIVTRRRLRLYFVMVALLLTVLVGFSRVALGVHYPSDVLAGWATGLVWALLCWIAARYLQQRGTIEKEDQPPPLPPQ